MGSDATVVAVPDSFPLRLKGRFEGLVRLADAFHLAANVVEYDGWYMLDPTDPDWGRQVTGAEVGCHLEGLLDEILREERGVWSTMVYVQNIANPQIVKVFHPRRAGCGCGGQGGVVPWWVLTRIKPEPVPEWEQISCKTDSPKRVAGGLAWIKKLF